MLQGAEELADLIVEQKAKKDQRSYERFNTKITIAISNMIRDLVLSIEIELDDEDLRSLIKITEKLRELGYRFRFIEIQDSGGEPIKHKLFISAEHVEL